MERSLQLLAGKVVRDMLWELKKGRVVRFDAESNLSAVKGRWEMARDNKDRIGSLILGINPGARFGYGVDSLNKGAVSISVGGNRDLEGRNNTDLTLMCSLSKATVELDGAPIVRSGKYAI
jgi:leucyl aminopeptidase (aminopeptidase T)